MGLGSGAPIPSVGRASSIIISSSIVIIISSSIISSSIIIIISSSSSMNIGGPGRAWRISVGQENAPRSLLKGARRSACRCARPGGAIIYIYIYIYIYTYIHTYKLICPYSAFLYFLIIANSYYY